MFDLTPEQRTKLIGKIVDDIRTLNYPTEAREVLTQIISAIARIVVRYRAAIAVGTVQETNKAFINVRDMFEKFNTSKPEKHGIFSNKTDEATGIICNIAKVYLSECGVFPKTIFTPSHWRDKRDYAYQLNLRTTQLSRLIQHILFIDSYLITDTDVLTFDDLVYITQNV